MKEPETPIQDEIGVGDELRTGGGNSRKKLAVCLRTVSRWERGWCTPRGEARLRLMALEKSA